MKAVRSQNLDHGAAGRGRFSGIDHDFVNMRPNALQASLAAASTRSICLVRSIHISALPRGEGEEALVRGWRIRAPSTSAEALQASQPQVFHSRASKFGSVRLSCSKSLVSQRGFRPCGSGMNARNTWAKKKLCKRRVKRVLGEVGISQGLPDLAASARPVHLEVCGTAVLSHAVGVASDSGMADFGALAARKQTCARKGPQRDPVQRSAGRSGYCANWMPKRRPTWS